MALLEGNFWPCFSGRQLREQHLPQATSLADGPGRLRQPLRERPRWLAPGDAWSRVKVADQVAGSVKSNRTTSRWSSPLRAAPTHAGFDGSDPDRRSGGGGSSCTSGCRRCRGCR